MPLVKVFAKTMCVLSLVLKPSHVHWINTYVRLVNASRIYCYALLQFLVLKEASSVLQVHVLSTLKNVNLFPDLIP